MGAFLCAKPPLENAATYTSSSGHDPAVHESNIQECDSEPKLHPKDFMLVNLQNQIVVKPPGSIQGQQFVIDQCKGCDIFLLDYSAQVTIDDSDNCRFFIGPCESSVFLRNCKDSKAIVACQQFRLRDCHNLDLLLYVSAGQPSIETSDKIRIGCFRFAYFDLQAQFDRAGLSVWNNQWSDVHDFNETKGEQHWTYLPSDIRSTDILKPLPEVYPTITPEEASSESVVPITSGSRPLQSDEVSFVAAFNTEAAVQLLAHLKFAGTGIQLVRTRIGKLRPDEVKALFDNQSKRALEATKGPVLGLEFRGADASATLSQACQNVVKSNDRFFLIASETNSVGAKMSNLFFEQFRPKI